MREDILNQLIALERNEVCQKQARQYPLTPIVADDNYVKNNDFAFLVGVICDQGVKTERAWAVPLKLAERLGHLDVRLCAAYPEQIFAAFQKKPVLHRYVDKVAWWVTAAAKKIVNEYDGITEFVWNGKPSVTELQKRFLAFEGIGLKKASMAISMLNRSRGVDIEGVDKNSIAVDVHVRRVLLRSGILTTNGLDVQTALESEFPSYKLSAVGFAAWLIGRRWCHASKPDCMFCAICNNCPKLYK